MALKAGADMSASDLMDWGPNDFNEAFKNTVV